ncbi:MAG TPA: hypothetical protein VFP72_22080 [Kineosporiaceae bacterium]|nr:hypothetical protein [Kineosporiaceae bacterium]
MSQPRTWPQTPRTCRARSLLAHAAADQTLDLEQRLAALDALGELEDDLPAGYAPAPVDPEPGRLTDAHRLLGEQGHDVPVRDRIAAARAAARLQPWTGARS